jgi:hypothetical protein
MPLDYPLWLRAAHFFNFLLLSLLIRSGLEILSAHPRLYWNDHCTTSSEWLKNTQSNETALGIEFVDVPIPTEQRVPIRFTFFWTKNSSWGGRDYMVEVDT